MSDGSKNRELIKMINNAGFTTNMFLHYLIRKYQDQDIMDNLSLRLYSFTDKQNNEILFYLIYFVLKFPNTLIETFLCDLCAKSPYFYFKIYTLTEAFAYEKTQQDLRVRNRVDKLMEAFEGSMVNEDNRYSQNSKKKVMSDQFEAMEHSINKRIKNDFKDDVKEFFFRVVQPSVTLKSLHKSERIPYLKAQAEEINDWFYHRRRAEEKTTMKGIKLLHGFTMPFENSSQSNTIVRLNKEEFLVFETKERCPYMCVFETIDADELEIKQPVFGKDPDFVKKRKLSKAAIEKEQHLSNRMLKKLTSMKNLHVKAKREVKSKFRSLSAHISDRIEAKVQLVSNPKWCQRKASLLKDFILAKDIKQGPPAKAQVKYWEHYYELVRNSIIRKKEFIVKKFIKPSKGRGPWKTLWKSREAQLRESSPYSHFSTLLIRPMMVKAGDDLRQELLALNLIRCFKDIFDKECPKIYLRPYDVIIRNHSSGFIEFIPDTISIDSLKKKHPEMSLDRIFKSVFEPSGLDEAQDNFLYSLAGYSIVCYILKIKDRHNGNILLDAEGHIIHIDFGFMLSNSPGGIDFESAPFKLTEEYVQILGGENSDRYTYFKVLLLQGFGALKKHSGDIMTKLEIMCNDSPLKCFSRFELKDIQNSFGLNLTDSEREQLVNSLIYQSFGSKMTMMYDSFQKYSNGIES